MVYEVRFKSTKRITQPSRKDETSNRRRRHMQIFQKKKERRSIDLRTSRQANSSSSSRMLHANTVRNHTLHSLDTSRSRRREKHVRQIYLCVAALKLSSYRISKDTRHYPKLISHHSDISTYPDFIYKAADTVQELHLQIYSTRAIDDSAKFIKRKPHPYYYIQEGPQ